MAILSNAPLGLFEPPGGGKPRIPRNVDESLTAMNLTGFQTAAVRDWVNAIAGSTRLLAHGQIFPGARTSASCSSRSTSSTRIRGRVTTSPTPRSSTTTRERAQAVAPRRREGRLSDLRADPQQPQGAEGRIRASSTSASTRASRPRPGTPEQGAPGDLPKVARDWPELNFIIYHACFGPRFFDAEALERSAPRSSGTACRPALAHRVRPDLGAAQERVRRDRHHFASCVITFPSVCAHMLGQLLKYMGPERIVFGSDSLWYGAPQWQIEAFWRFQIPQDMAKKYGYPSLNEKVKRQILGLNSARLYNLPNRVAAYKPVPADYERRIPASLKATLNFPGFSKPGARIAAPCSCRRPRTTGSPRCGRITSPRADIRITADTAGSTAEGGFSSRAAGNGASMSPSLGGGDAVQICWRLPRASRRVTRASRSSRWCGASRRARRASATARSSPQAANTTAGPAAAARARRCCASRCAPSPTASRACSCLSPETTGGASGMVALQMTCESGGTVEIYVEPVLPARARPLRRNARGRGAARIGEAMGYRVERGPERRMPLP